MFGQLAGRASILGLAAGQNRRARDPSNVVWRVRCVRCVRCVRESAFGVRHDRRQRRRVPLPSKASRPSGSTCAIRPNKQSGRFRWAWMIEATGRVLMQTLFRTIIFELQSLQRRLPECPVHVSDNLVEAYV